MSTPFERMQKEFRDKEYRHEYADGFLNSKIATQLKVLREERGWTQQQLAQATGMQQARISVMEDVDYSAWSLSTLRRYARAFDVRLDVEFKEFGTLWPDLQNLTREALQRRSFDDDPAFQERAAAFADQSQASVMQENNPFVSGSVQTTTNLSNNATINMSTLTHQHERQQRSTRQLELPLFVLFQTDSNQIAAEAVIETAHNPQGEVTRDRGTAEPSRVA